jgi:hypothetical protein
MPWLLSGKLLERMIVWQKSEFKIRKKKKRKRESIEDKHGYANPNFIVGSAAEVERLWSMAGLIMTDKRYSTTPMN